MITIRGSPSAGAASLQWSGPVRSALEQYPKSLLARAALPGYRPMSPIGHINVLRHWPSRIMRHTRSFHSKMHIMQLTIIRNTTTFHFDGKTRRDLQPNRQVGSRLN